MEFIVKRRCLRVSAQKFLGKCALRREHLRTLPIVQLVLSATPFNSGECRGPGLWEMPALARYLVNSLETYSPPLSDWKEMIGKRLSFSKQAPKISKHKKTLGLDFIGNMEKYGAS
jgi:hypothetical protein